MAAELHADKNRAYRDAWRSQGWRGNLGRVLNKATRLRNMMWRREVVEDELEPPESTMIDALNILVYTLINYQDQNEWGNDG
jgi:hypothetical protein